MSLFAGIDAGTQSIKLLVYDAERREVVASNSAPLELISGQDGAREQQASWWVDGVRRCFDRLDARIRSQIVALSVSGQQHGFVPLGRDGEVLAPVKLWCDTSSDRECAEIMDAVGGVERCIALAGNPILAGYTASKVRWTRRHRPDVYRALDAILLPHDYLNYHLTGERFCEYGDASGTGWFDVRERRWSSELLAAIDPRRDLATCLPPLVDRHQTFALRPQLADTLGLSRGVRVGVGGGDNMMAAIGTGCVVPGRLGMSLGTSGTLFAAADQPVVDAHGAWAAFCSSSGGWLPLICTMNCTVATETMARQFGYDARAADAALDATAPGADGLSLLPFFNGERTPDLPHARGAMLGMTPTNVTNANLHRAAMEGATYTLRNGYDGFAASGLPCEAIVLTGGGSKSAAWRQMIADVFALPVQVPVQAEGAAFGAALQAMCSWRRGQDEDIDLPALVALHVQTDSLLAAQPDAGSVAAYVEPFARFRAYLHALAPVYASERFHDVASRALAVAA